MDKQQVIEFLEKAGIWVKDGKIAKADIAKAKIVLESMKTVADSPDATLTQLRLEKILKDAAEADTYTVKVYHEAVEYSDLKKQDLSPKEDEIARKIRAHLEAVLENVNKVLEIV